jgi:2-oxoisovalerate dehydrogenase E2 component (dihydrolipoyl transacylase)
VARYTFRLPDIGEGIAEAEIVAWHIKLGDRVEEDARLADVMTDKATVELESPVSGVVVELAGEAGDRLAIGSALVVLEVEGAESEADVSGGPSTSPAPADTRAAVATKEPAPKPAEHAPVQAAAASGKVLASPAVRARARALNIDLAKVRAGAQGRIGHAELDVFLTTRTSAPTPSPSSPEPAFAQLEGASETIKIIGLRRRIAEAMSASKRHIPHFSYVEECDVTALEQLRADLNEQRGLNGKDGRPKLTVLPLMIRAICRALPDYPMINARFDDQAGEVTRYASVHLGIATQTDAGLIVPVIRDAQALTLWQLGEEIARLATAARDGSAKPAELSGSTLTLTSLGPLGGVATTPVINRPEVAIIGPNRIIERPVYVGDQIERRKLMNISISCDHRVVDGWDAANFIQAVKRQLEMPLQMLA